MGVHAPILLGKYRGFKCYVWSVFDESDVVSYVRDRVSFKCSQVILELKKTLIKFTLLVIITDFE